MRDEQILKKALEKVGWDLKLYKDIVFAGDGMDYDHYAIIFSHSFAKAFWGEEEVTGMRVVGFDEKHIWRWFEYHLMRMALEEQPLKYIEKFL